MLPNLPFDDYEVMPKSPWNYALDIDLDDTAKVTLKAQAEWLQTYTDYKVKIQGFTDDPTQATATQGQAWLAHLGDELAARLVQLAKTL